MPSRGRAGRVVTVLASRFFSGRRQDGLVRATFGDAYFFGLGKGVPSSRTQHWEVRYEVRACFSSGAAGASSHVACPIVVGNTGGKRASGTVVQPASLKTPRAVQLAVAT